MTPNPYAVASDREALPDENGDFDLDALLADSLQSTKDKATLKKQKEKLQSTWLSGTEKSQLKHSVTRLSLAHEWEPVAAVALFHTQRCISCGTRHTHFMGVFQQQRQAAGGLSGMMTAEKWVRAIDNTMIDGLPKQQKVTDEPVDMCECCAVSLGFPPQLYA